MVSGIEKANIIPTSRISLSTCATGVRYHSKSRFNRRGFLWEFREGMSEMRNAPSSPRYCRWVVYPITYKVYTSQVVIAGFLPSKVSPMSHMSGFFVINKHLQHLWVNRILSGMLWLCRWVFKPNRWLSPEIAEIFRKTRTFSRKTTSSKETHLFSGVAPSFPQKKTWYSPEN